MTPRTHATAALAALSMLLLAAGPAWAAPQILGLVASNGMPTPLSCADGQCSGLVNSFCLQFARPSPDDGSAYSLLPGGGITILGLRADGSSFRLAGAGLVTLRSRAGFSAVTVSVPESALRKIGAVSASVEVEALTAALPVAVAGDSDPETQADIDQATGALRQLAQSTFEAPGQKRRGQDRHLRHRQPAGDRAGKPRGARDGMEEDGVNRRASRRGPASPCRGLQHL